MFLKIFGEVLSLGSSSLELYERGVKTYKKSIVVGLIRYTIQALAYICLGGINGAIVTIMAIIRHGLMYYKKFTTKAFVIWITCSIIVNLMFVKELKDFIPLIGTLQFSLMAKKQNILWLKYAQIVNSVIWIIYHILNKNYVYFVTSIILIIIGLVSIFKLKKQEPQT